MMALTHFTDAEVQGDALEALGDELAAEEDEEDEVGGERGRGQEVGRQRGGRLGRAQERRRQACTHGWAGTGEAAEEDEENKLGGPGRGEGGRAEAMNRQEAEGWGFRGRR